MTNQSYIAIGLAMVLGSVLILGNRLISFLLQSDTRKFRAVDFVKLLDNYRTSLKDEKLRQALSLLGRDRSYYDAKVASSLLLSAISSVALAFATLIFVGNFIVAVVVLAGGLVVSLPLSVTLAKATVTGVANTERSTFRSILAMYLMVLGVALRKKPIELALSDIADVTYSPIAERITNEIKRRIDSAAQASLTEGAPKDMSLGQAMIDLGNDWAIPELELIGEIMHGSVFSAEALSDMILKQSETMKKTLMRDYAKKIESQRPKLSMFALLQVLPLIIFLVVPIMSSFGKSGL